MTPALVLVLAALLSIPSTAVGQSAPAASNLRFEEASIWVNGTFDFDLRFTDDLAPDARFPSLFRAVEEQLQLKLESMRGPVDDVVIDRIEKPIEN